MLVSARSPSDDSVRCDAPHLANVRFVKAQDFGNKGQPKIDTRMVLEEQHAGVCLQPAALQESPWAGNDRRVLWVGVVVLHPHLQARKYSSGVLYWGFFCKRLSPSPIVDCLIEIAIWES